MVDSETNGPSLRILRLRQDARNDLIRYTIQECHTIDNMTQRLASSRLLAFGALTIAVVFVLDQITKWIIIQTIGPDAARRTITIVPGVLEFVFVRNTGSAFGLFQGSSDFLKIAAVIAVMILLVYYIRSAAHDWVISIALGLQLGGAFGNIADRYRHGYVVDFIDFPRFPTFNVADSAITVGVVILIYALLFRDVDRRHAADGSGDSQVAVREDA